MQRCFSLAGELFAVSAPLIAAPERLTSQLTAHPIAVPPKPGGKIIFQGCFAASSLNSVVRKITPQVANSLCFRLSSLR